MSVPPGGRPIGERLTWDHLDGGVHLPPVLSAVELPVQEEVAVVGDHGPLREQQLGSRIVPVCFGFRWETAREAPGREAEQI